MRANFFGVLIVGLLLNSCTTNTNQLSENNPETESDSYSASINLTENSINGIKLPLSTSIDLDSLKTGFESFSIQKELGQFEYGRAYVFNIIHDGQTIGFFEMNAEDSTKLNNIYLLNLIKDEYGLSIGDSFNRIKSNRNDSLKFYTDFHQRTFVILENSNIMYEIFGNWPDDSDLENPTFTEKQIQDWKIEKIIWRKYPDQTKDNMD